MSDIESKLQEPEGESDEYRKLDVEAHGVSIISDESGGIHVIPIDGDGVYLNTFSIMVDEISISSIDVESIDDRFKLEDDEEIPIFIKLEEEHSEAVLG